jgi:hypothetical protein
VNISDPSNSPGGNGKNSFLIPLEDTCEAKKQADLFTFSNTSQQLPLLTLDDASQQDDLIIENTTILDNEIENAPLIQIKVYK